MLELVTNLCKPAKLYLVISVIALVVMFVQNLNNNNVYCLGNFKCDVPSVTVIFVVKMLYVIFWTWILNIICKQGYTNVSWLLVLLPFILLFILVAMMVFSLPPSA